MMKFLTNSKCNEQNQNNTCNIFTQSRTQCNNLQNTINPNNVKLLSDDNAGNDFLTLCAIKRSEEEISSKTVHKMDTTYVPTPKPVKDLFNFVLPDIQVIDCFFMKLEDISAEREGCKDDFLTQSKNNESENIHNNNDCIDINDDNFWCTIRNEKNIDNNEIRFEDILDESSDSNKTTISYPGQQVRDVEINSNNIKVSVSDRKDDKIMTDIGIEIPNNTTDLESSLFENILNESFSSIEDNLENEDMPQQNIVSSNSSSVIANIKKINITDENTVNTFHNKNNTKSNSNLSLFMEPAKPQRNQFMKNFIDEIQDFDFNSDDDISEFVRHESNRNKSKHNSKTEESLLSITQAINEIAGIKKNFKVPKSVCKEESINENNTGWISVNTKNDTKIEKKNTSLKIEEKLSDFCNSTAKSCTVEQNFDFPDDSDEDFMIIENNAKKFNELESCYFRDMSKNWEDESNWLPSTSKNSEDKTNYFGNTSNNMTPCGTSTPTSNRRAGLSLKRNKVQHLDKIDLSVFQAPSKCTNNIKNKNILESSSPKQMFSDKIIAQKISHKYKRENNVKNEFIDDEAEVDSDASSDEIINIDEEDFADFVSYTQQQDEVDMHAHYLQTIKSPIKRPGAFHFRKPRSPDVNIEIYSQPLSQVQDSYLYVRKLSDALQSYNRFDFYIQDKLIWNIYLILISGFILC